MPTFPAATLTDFADRILQAAGVPPVDAGIVARGLVGANLRGHDSHGLMRLPQYLDFLGRGEYRTGVALIVEQESPAVVACDAQWGFGQVQAHRLLDRIMPKAKTLGIAAGSARRCGHVGRLGEYAERAALEDLILIATVNNNGGGQRVAPPGGLAGRLGTNPLCVAVPHPDGPIVLDFGTSVAAEGKVRVHYINKTPVPDGWLLDHQGQPTTDPAVLYEPPTGTIRPMGGDQAYKGFGLAFVLDLLSAGLAGGRTSFEGSPPAKGNNLLLIALDPASFAGRDHLIRETLGLVSFVRDCPRADGIETIVLPGDPERRALEARTRDGIPLADAHWARLIESAEKLGVPAPTLA